MNLLQSLILMATAMFFIVWGTLTFVGCSDSQIKTISDAIEAGLEVVESPTPEATKTPTSEPVVIEEVVVEAKPVEAPKPVRISLPDNCSNPPVRPNGLKCLGSATRGGSVVCLLPSLFMWAPFKTITDHHNQTFVCNKNDRHFDAVDLIVGKKRYSLNYAGCHNPEYTVNGKIGRQHFRDESLKYDSIKNKKSIVLEMSLGGQTTCLRWK